MRAARSLVVSVVLALTATAGTQAVAVAAGGGSGASLFGGKAPRQASGSAAGRAHSAAAAGAAAGGGHRGPLAAPGELPVDGGLPPTGATAPAAPEAPPLTPTTVPDVTVQGFDAQRSREVPAQRQSQSRTYSNPDGTLTTQFYDEPVNFRGPGGGWTPIDTRLVRPAGVATMDGSDDQGFTTAATQDGIAFSGYADEAPVVDMALPTGQSVGFAVDQAAHAAARTDGDTVAYDGVRPGADLRFVAGNDSVKETIELDSPDAPTHWSFPLQLDGLTPALDAATGAVVLSDAAGVQRARIPAGWMEDSHPSDGGEGAISTGVHYSLGTQGGRPALEVDLDQAWLASPDRVFPVSVDPSVESVDATSGTYVESPYNTDFSGDTVLKTGTYDGGGHKAAAFLRFNGVETTLKNAWITNANLNLYNTFSDSCTARPVTISPITSNWSESTTVKYPGPATGASLASKSFAHGWRPAGTTTWSCAAAWEGIKLGTAGRQLVDDWTHGRKKNYGLAVKASTTDTKAWKQFGSDDYPNGKPRLDVTWTKYGATYKVGSWVTPVTATAPGAMTVTVTNQGQATWPKGGNYQLRYNLFDASGTEITDKAKIAWTKMPSDVAPGKSVTLTAQIAAMAPATYTLQWTMDDVGISRFTSAGVPGPAVKFSAVNVPPRLTGESPAGGAVLDSLTPTLYAAGTDSDHYPSSALQYSFEVCEVSGTNARVGCRTGTRGTSKMWAVPAGWLSWDKEYAWYGYVYDGKDTSARPGPSYFTTQVPQPVVTSHLGKADSGHEYGAQAGNYITAATDAALPTVGPELSVTRTYNSQDPRPANVFGAGWATRWDMRLRDEPQTSSALITLADGSEVRYGKNADGSYTSPAGDTTSLTKTTGGWTLRDHSGGTSTFDSSGLLTSVADSSGHTQTLTYTSGRLTKATDALSGRFLSFTWSGAHIGAVTTSPASAGGAGLTWTYGYDGDRLTTVCPPSSATECTAYAYTDGSLYRSEVLDADPTHYWRLGESDGSAATDEVPAVGDTGQGLYRDAQLAQGGALAGTTDGAAAFDGTDSEVDLPRDTLRTSAFLSVELWFKTTQPGVLMGFQDGALDEGQPDHWTPTLTVDQSGHLRGEFWTGTVKPITSTATVNDGQWHHVVLSGAGTTQTLYLDGAAAGTLTGPIDHLDQSYTYLGAGYFSTGWGGPATAAVDHFTGEIDDVAVYQHPLDAATVGAHYASRAATGLVSRVTLPSGRVHATTAYDPATSRITSTTDENGGTWQVSAPAYGDGSDSYADAVLGSHPDGYWRLGDRSGATAANIAPGGSDASYLDGTTLGAAGAFTDTDDTAVTFDGKNGAVEIPGDTLATSTTGAMSLELWFKTTKSGPLLDFQNTELGDQATVFDPSLVISPDGHLHAYLWNGYGGPDGDDSDYKVNDGQWHHVVLTGDDEMQRVYLDGSMFSGQSVKAPLGPETYDHIYLGAGFSGPDWDGQPDGTRYFSGQIDEAAIYSRALSEQEVADHYQARTDLVSGTQDGYTRAALADDPAAYYPLRWVDDAPDPVTAPNLVAATPNSAAGFLGDILPGIYNYGAFGTDDDSGLELEGAEAMTLPGSTLLAGTTNLSVEMWFEADEPSGVLLGAQNQPVGSQPTSWRDILNIDATGHLRGEFYLTGDPGAKPITSTQVVTDSAWHHVVLSGAGTTQSLYLDGDLVGSISGTISAQNLPYTTIGAGWGSSGWMGLPAATYWMHGFVSAPAIYRHTLTAAQAAAHYAAGRTSATPSLTSTVTVTDPGGATTSSTYDMTHGQRVIASASATGGVTRYTYDTGGYLHAVTDPDGHAVVTGHDARGNTVSRTTCRDADSCWTSFTDYYLNTADPLDPRNDKPTAVRDARSSDPADNRYRTQLAYTAAGLPTVTTLADGRSSAIAYTAGTEPAAAGGGVEPKGLVAAQTTTGGAVTSYSYFADGDVASVTSPSGLLTRYTYDGLGRKLTGTEVSDSFPAGVTTSYRYDTASHTVEEKDAPVTDELTGVTHTADVTRTFDADGNQLTQTVSDATGGDAARTETRHYDEHGLPDTDTDPAGGVTHQAYDAFGRVSSQTDALGTRYAHTFTPDGLPAETVLKDWTGDPAGGDPHDLVVTSDAYDPAGRLASTTDAMGATTAYRYYDDGLLAATVSQQVTRADGSKHDIVQEADTYDGAGNLTTQVTGGGAATTTYTVDAAGRLTRSDLDPGGLDRWTAYTYDGDDHVLTQTQPTLAPGDRDDDSVLTLTNTYDKAGDTLSSTVDNGTQLPAVTTTAYDQRGLPTAVTSPRGNAAGADPAAFTAAYRYDALGELVQTTLPAVDAESGGAPAASTRPTTLTGYDTFGEATDSQDADGRTTRTELDLLGRPVAVTLPGYTPPGGDPITAVARTGYDALSRVTSRTDPLGRRTAYSYDQLGDQTFASVPFQQSPFTEDRGTRTAYTATGLPLTVTDPTGAVTQATYDELGRQLTQSTVERYPASAVYTSRFTWDDAGRETASTTPTGLTSGSAYDAAGETTATTEPSGAVTRFGYDGLGRQNSVTSPSGIESDTEYDLYGNQTIGARYDAAGNGTITRSDSYDTDGNLINSEDAKGNQTRYTYDAGDRLTSETEPVSDGRSITTRFGYDAAGNRTRLTDGRGDTTVYTYNTWGLPESTVEPATDAHPDAASRTWTLGYDAAGQNTTRTEPGGTTLTFGFDLLGDPVTEDGSGGQAPAATRTLGYDLDGRLTSTGGAGLTAENTYTYDDRGLMLTSQGQGGHSVYGYDADSRLTSRQDASGTATYGYNPAGQLDRTTDPLTGGSLTATYTADDQVRTEQYADASGAPTALRTYGYDAVGRLSSDTLANSAGALAGTTYGYDDDDLLTAKTTTGTAGATASTYGYDDAGRLTSWKHGATTTTYTWDDAGNRTSADGQSATFDARNEQLTEGATSFGYDARGNRTSTTSAGTTTTASYDAFDRMTSDGQAAYTYDSLDRLASRDGTAFTYDGGSNSVVSDGTDTFSHTADGAPLAAGAGGTGQWQVTDLHTDVVAGLTADGDALAGSTAYDPFGDVIASAGDPAALGFQSAWTDPATGKVDMAARWYQPDTGTFTARDSATLDPDPSVRANRYTYGDADPLGTIDPTGHFSWKDVLGIGIDAAKYLKEGSPGGLAWDAFWNTYIAGENAISREGDACPHGEGTCPGAYPFNPTQPKGTSCLCMIGGGSGSVSHSYGYSYSDGDGNGYGNGGGGGSRGGGNGTALRPRPKPKPPIDQNPNNGPHPIPAPTLPPALTVAPNAIWHVGGAVVSTLTPQMALDLIGVSVFVPLTAVETHALIDNVTGTDDDDTDGDCRRDGQGWVDFTPRDTAHGDRATGVDACLDQQYLATHQGSATTRNVRPPGYNWARDYARHVGLVPMESINNCHLLGNQLSGSGQDLRNLATCTRAANAKVAGAGSIDTHMASYEEQVYDAVEAGQTVHYSVTAQYLGDRTVPVSFELTAHGVYPGGAPGLSFSQPVPNSFLTKNQGWKNLGSVTDSRTGQPVPTGNTS